VTPRHAVFLGSIAITLSACAHALVDDAGPSPAPKAPPGSIAPSPTTSEPAPSDGASVDASIDGASSDASVDGGTDATTPTTPIVVTPPTLDGTIASGEYGAHVNGQNQEASLPGTSWYMTWTATSLYVAVTAANLSEGVVLYVEHAPLAPSNGGADADGSLAGFAYDNTMPASLPFRADFVAYVKSGYNEYRRANGANGWSAPVVGALTMQAQGTVREIEIPWTAIRASGRPPSFAWLGYATSAGGYVYGGMPSSNPSGVVGTNGAFKSFYRVDDSTPGSGTKPFAMKLGI
jgi:hypothetical protein